MRSRNPDGTFASEPWPERFWALVERADGCWEWQGTRNNDGYGSVRHRGRMRKAHRVSWELVNGTIPRGKQVCHHCDNPPCCNPAHLFVGTNRANAKDRHRKGRTKNLAKGPEAHRAKTHCPKGHPYTGDNVRYRSDGRRRCAACYRLRSKRYREQTRDTINARKRANRRNP